MKISTLEETVVAHTVIASPPLCPEVKLHLVTEACPLWRATEADLERLGLSPPYWAFCWPGGQALTRYVLDNPDLVSGRRVLDFGAGCGIEAIAAMQVGAAWALGADIDPYAAAAMRLNAALNGVVLETTTENLVGVDGGWEVVLAGDVFYDRDFALEVFAWLEALAARGALVLLGDPHRGYLPSERVRAVAEYQAPSDVDVGGRFLKRTTVFRLEP